jgi:hypothetical protein
MKFTITNVAVMLRYAGRILNSSFLPTACEITDYLK